MDNSFDSLLNVSAVPQDDKVQAFIAESKNNRNRCYELSEQVTAQVATDGQMFQKYLDVQSTFDRYTANNALLILAQRPDAQRLELMMALFNIVQGVTSTIMKTAGFGSTEDTVLPDEIIKAVEDCGFFESIPLWAVTLIGGLFITVLSFIMIMSVYGRFFRLYLYTAIAPIPLSSFAGEPSQNIGRSFLKSYAAVCLEGAIVVLACIIFSLFASSPPVVNPDAAAVTMVWSYIGELIFNMLVLVGAVKMSDRVVREMMGL